VVVDARGRRHLIPTARDILQEIDLEEGRITVAALPGLVDQD
jgi:ribosomal 30S subunit maturation factor RimM